MSDDAILDDLFHGCALFAFVEEARRAGTWPDAEVTRRAAYRMYERALAQKNPRNGTESPTSPFTSADSSGMVEREPTEMGGKEVHHARDGKR